MKHVIFILAICMLSIPAFAQHSVYVFTGESVYATSAERSAYITAPRATRMNTTGSRNVANGITNGFRNSDGMGFFDRSNFDVFTSFFPSVYMWGNGWLGRPLIDTGAIGRPLIDAGSLGRPEIDTGVAGFSGISPRSLRLLDPHAHGGPAFSGRTTGAARTPGAARTFGGSRAGGARFGGSK